MRGPINHKYMLNSISPLLPANNKWMCAAITSSMLAEGDTSISNITSMLAVHSMMLKTVNGNIFRRVNHHPTYYKSMNIP